jgi:hypothetical protein
MLEQEDVDIYEANKKINVRHLTELSIHYTGLVKSIKDFDENLVGKTFSEVSEMEKEGFKLRAQSIRHIKISKKMISDKQKF